MTVSAHTIGHIEAQTQLYEWLSQQRLPHACIVHGVPGIGKRRLADTFGQVLLCGGGCPGGQLQPDTTSPIYAQIQAGACADYVVVAPLLGPNGQPQGGIKLEQVREALQNLRLKSLYHRVVIIDAVDDLSPEAANMLLKNLEEPSPHTYFFLIAHNTAKVLPTIRSRCRALPLLPLTLPDCQEVLQGQLSATQVADLFAVLGGVPGQMVQFGETGLAVVATIHTVRTGQEAAGKAAEALHKQQAVPLLLDMLLQQTAQQARQGQRAAAQTYQDLHRLQQDFHTLNLTATWVAEHALRLALRP